MTGLVRKASLLAAAGVLMASAAFAGVPSAANSTAPNLVPLVSRTAVGNPDAGLFGGLPPSFTINVRDLANNPLNNASVVLDFSLTQDLQICGDQQDVDALVNCVGKTVRKFTDVAGNVTFNAIRGGGKAPGPPVAAFNAGRIFANGVLIKSPTVCTGDLNGAGGTNAFDKAVMLSDINAFGLGFPHGRANLNGDAAINAFDMAVLLTHINNGGTPLSQTCETLGNCP